MSDRIVLAYSGGLDTSVCIGWLAEETGQEVVAVAVDVGQGGEDLEVIRQRALDCGAVEAVVVDAKDEFAEDIWNAPIEDVYAYTADPAVPREPDEVTITFEAGNPIAIDNEKVSMLQVIQILNERAGAQGVGRLDMVEDRLVGIKSREVYEAPGAITLITAHQELEAVTVERDLARFKRTVDQPWAELTYDGLGYSPLKQALHAL